MNNKPQVFVLVAVVAALILGAAAYSKPVVVNVAAPSPVALGSAGSSFTEKQSFLAGYATAAGTVSQAYATTTAWDSGSVALDTASTTAFLLRPAGQLRKLPAVGDVCSVGNPNASTSRAESYQFNITAVDTLTASGSLNYTNKGPAIDYGIAALNIKCESVSGN